MWFTARATRRESFIGWCKSCRTFLLGGAEARESGDCDIPWPSLVKSWPALNCGGNRVGAFPSCWRTDASLNRVQRGNCGRKAPETEGIRVPDVHRVPRQRKGRNSLARSSPVKMLGWDSNADPMSKLPTSLPATHKGMRLLRHLVGSRRASWRILRLTALRAGVSVRASVGSHSVGPRSE